MIYGLQPLVVKAESVAEPTNADSKFGITYVGQEGNKILSADSNDKGTIIADTSGNLLLSTDYGEKWSKQPLPAQANFHTVKHAGDTFYFWTYNTNQPQTFWSHDGRQWNSFSVEGQDGALTPKNVFMLRGEYVMLAGYDAEDNTYVFTSVDGVSWQKAAEIPSDNISELTWNGQVFTALGGGYLYYGSAKERNQFALPDKKCAELIIYTSSNLKNWTLQSGAIKSSLHYTFTINGIPAKNYSVHLHEQPGNGVIKLYDDYGNVLTSKDGIKFLLQAEPAIFKKLYGRGPILSNGKLHLIFASYWREGGVVLTSKDKSSWSVAKISNIPLGMQVLKSGQKFIGFGVGGMIAVSNDGLSWTIKRGPAPAQYINEVIKANGRYVAVGSEFAYSVPAILSSKDGYAWSEVLTSDRSKTSEADIQSVDWNGKLFVAVGGTYSYTSTDGVKWHKYSASQDFNLHKVVWTGKKFAALGDTNNKGKRYIVYSSSDGVNWKACFSTTNAITDIASHAGTVVAVGTKNNQGLALASSDLNKWHETPFTLGKNNKSWKSSMASASFDYNGAVTFSNVQWLNNRFVIVSDSIYSSSDGVNWSVINGDYDQYVQQGAVWKSSGRIIWTGQDYRYYKNGILGVSQDLKQWDFHEFDHLSQIKTMMWTGTDLLGAGDNGLMIRIKD